MYKEVLRILKPKGMYLNWTFVLDNFNQKFFKDAVRFKDKLAGFEDLVKNRYFMTKKEFSEDIKKAGFSSLKFYNFGIYYTLSTKKWCEIDFRGDKEKQIKLNEFIKELIGRENHEGIEIKINGDDIQMKIPALISVAVK